MFAFVQWDIDIHWLLIYTKHMHARKSLPLLTYTHINMCTYTHVLHQSINQAISVLRAKCHAVLQAIEEAGEGGTGGAAAGAAGAGAGDGPGKGGKAAKGKGSKGGGGGGGAE